MDQMEILYITNGILGFLLVISEYLSWSTCNVNSISQWIHSNFICYQQE